MSNRRTLSGRTWAVAVFSAAVAGSAIAVFGSAARAQTPPRAGQPAELVLRNGRLATVNPARPEAQALAARGGKIVAVGTNEEIQAFVGPSTRVLDLGGKRAVPGFIDGHGHFTGVGEGRINLKLMDVRNWDEVVARVGAAAAQAKPGDWILGRGWHQEKWDKVPSPNVEGFPTHASLSRVSPNNPVLLTHASGHAGFANAKALELAGITKDTPSPAGGDILKDASGQPTGLLRETAAGLVGRALRSWETKRTPAEREAAQRRVFALASEECLSKGVTSFQDAGTPFDTLDSLKKYVEEGKMGVRLWMMVRDDNTRMAQKLPAYRMVGVGDDHLTIRAIKKTIDGALGSRGAWLLEPYADSPGSSGLNTTPVPEVREAARLAIENGFQMCVHAIGDRANRETLDIFEAAFKSHPDKKDLRWRVEHAQHLSPADIPRFGKLGVIASMQGIHCTSDAPFVIARLGQKRAEEGAYVWQKLMKSGAVVSNGTDAPVEDVDPIANYYATVTRRLKDGSVFFGDQRMSREEALRSYTLSAAYAAFEEGVKGSLEVGKLADVTVLSKDILTVPESEIPTARVVYTIVGGKVMFSVPGGPASQ
jgi:predicted amidohydrolase YtcJ